MSFPNLTSERIEEISASIADLFDKGCVEETQVKVTEAIHYHNGTSQPAIRIEIGAMYEKPRQRDGITFLAALNRIAEITGCKEVDKDELGHGGCETCDYGSYYAWEFYCFDPINE